MKIRTDFVTNSSSSCFTIVIAIETKDGRVYSYTEAPRSESEVGECHFRAGIGDLLKKHDSIRTEEGTADQDLAIGTVAGLARYLVNNIDNSTIENFYYFGEADCDYAKEFMQKVDLQRERFVLKVTKNISSISDIAKISVHRDYSANGEFADLVADNDSELCELAAKVNSTSGEEQKKALHDMLAYIRMSSSARFCEEFGKGYEDFRYAWNGDEKALIALAKRLHSGFGPYWCSGREHDEIDLVLGTVCSYAEFDLS